MRPVLALALVLIATAALAHEAAEAPPPPPGPDTPITAMVRVPAGEFTMGRAGSDEMPAHRVKVGAFMMDLYEVTNAQYQAYCDATGARLPVFWGLEKFRCGEQWPDHPVVGVNRGNAEDYAAWVGKRLPTEAEWEYAALAGGSGRFGAVDTLTTELANYKSSDRKATAPAMSYPPNAFGLYDLIGNVREWTADSYGVEIPDSARIPDDGSLDGVVPRDNPVYEAKNGLGIVKSGGWYSGSSCNAAAERNGYPAGWSDFNVGFRCVRDVD